MATRQVIHGTTTSSQGASTRYISPFCAYRNGSWSVTAADEETVLNDNGTFNKLRIDLTFAPGSGQSRTFTLYKNGVATALTVTVSNTDTTATDSTNSVSVSAGDTVYIGMTTSASAAGARVMFALEWVAASGSGKSIWGLGGSSLSGAATNYSLAIGSYGWLTANNGNARSVVTAAGTLTGVRYRLATAPGSGKSWSITVYKNDVAEASTTVTIADLATTGSASFSVSCAIGDYLRIIATPTNTPATSVCSFAGSFTATTDGEFNVCGWSTGFLVTGVRYVPIIASPEGWDATENAVERLYGGATTITVKNLYVRRGATDTTADWTFRKNGADTALVAVMAGTTTASDLVNTVSLAAGDTFDLEYDGTSGFLPTVFWGYTGLSQTTIPVPQQKVTQAVLELLCDEDAEAGGDSEGVEVSPCVGGGTVASGTNPTAGSGLTAATQPLAWVEVTTEGTTYRWSKVAINASARKEPRVVSFGRIVRPLADPQGGFETASVTVVLSDHDRLLRGLADSGTLMNQPADVYLADIATLATPRRMFRGKIRDFRPDSNLTFTLVIEDALTLSASAFAGDTLVPRTMMRDDDIVTDQTMEQYEWPAPIVYGSLSDEDALIHPDGVIIAHYVDTRVVTGSEALGELHMFMVCVGAISQIQNVYTAVIDPQREAEEQPPLYREHIPASALGDWIWVPGMTGWLHADPWSEFNGRRYTVIYGKPGRPEIEHAKNSNARIMLSVCGYETTGDGTGNTITSPPRVLLHFLNNFVIGDATANWLPIQDITGGGYSVFDTTSFEAVHAITDRMGLTAERCLGHMGERITLREFIQQFCICFGLELGVNWDGQIMCAMLDRGVTGEDAPSFTDGLDVVRGSLFIDLHTDEFENRIDYSLERWYRADALLPTSFPPVKWHEHGSVENADSVSEIGETRHSEEIELEWVWRNDGDVALLAMTERLHLRARPRAEATFETTLNRGLDLELGDIIKLTHFAGLSSSGWTERRCRVRRLTLDLDRFTVAVTAQDVDDLLPNVAEEASAPQQVRLSEVAVVDAIPRGSESLVVGAGEAPALVVSVAPAESAQVQVSEVASVSITTP